MDKIVNCMICGKNIASQSCQMCGAVVCSACFDQAKESAKPAAQEKDSKDKLFL